MCNNVEYAIPDSFHIFFFIYYLLQRDSLFHRLRSQSDYMFLSVQRIEHSFIN